MLDNAGIAYFPSLGIPQRIERPPEAKEVIGMAGLLRVSRSRGAMSGVLLVLLGLWGGLIPLVGPYVHYAYTPNHVWTITSGRVWLEIVPAGVALLGGLILLVSKLRPI